jgi:hypothetical protein
VLERHVLPCEQLKRDRVPRVGFLRDVCAGQLYAVHFGVVLQHYGSDGRDGRLHGRILLSYRLVVGHASDVLEWHVLPCEQLERDRVSRVCVLRCVCTFQLYALYAGLVLQHDRSFGQDCVHGRLVLQCFWSIGCRWHLHEWHLLSGWQHGPCDLHCVGFLSIEWRGELYALHVGVVL